MAERLAIVAGCGGIVGYRLARHLSDGLGWRTVGLSRSAPPGKVRFPHMPVDLSRTDDCRDKLAHLHEATHLFYTARSAHAPGKPESSAANLAMLKNVLDVLEPVAKNLRHVHLVHGTKYYGAPYGRYKTPAKESDPRHPRDCFYFAQQDFIVARQKGKGWTWSISRPQAVSDYEIHIARSIPLGIAVYASLCKANRSPLVFPGSTAAYQALYQCTDAEHLAKAIAWMSTSAHCANQAFNVTNGDYFRWENLWPRFAEYFDVPLGTPQPISLQAAMPAHAATWQQLAEKHALKKRPFDGLVDWRYLDFALSPEHDRMSDVTKLRQFGFGDVVDSEEMFERFFATYQTQHSVPAIRARPIVKRRRST